MSGSVNYDPWIKRDPALPNPVIIVPGMMGSELLDEDKIAGGLIWPSLTKVVTYIFDEFLDVLKLDERGNLLQNNIVVGDMVKGLNETDYFLSLINELESKQYLQSDTLFTFPYDWRIEITQSSMDSTTNSILSLAEKISEVKTQTGAEKVNIIAHSMGGLLVKKYLSAVGGDSVDKFIDVGTPHSGAPSAFKVLTYGDNLGVSHFFGLVGVNSLRIKSISQNMPAVYELLPSRSYFDDSDNSYKYYVFDAVGGQDRLSFDQTKDYLKSTGRNRALVERADEFHQEIDGLNPADYGVETYNIVGCGVPTIGQFYILDNREGHHNYNIKMINGDGTVPLKSAEALPSSQTFYVKNVQHAIMPSASGVKELIVSILTNEPLNVSNYSNLVGSRSECPIPDGKIVSFHSPINLHVYDSSGNHTGPDENDDIENNISGVVYETIEDNSFAFLPEGQEYQVVGESTGSGTFDVRIEELEDEEVVQTTIFADVPLSETTTTNFDLGVNIPSQIYLDSDGDGNFETTVAVSSTHEGFLESTGSSGSENAGESVSESIQGSSRPATPIISQTSETLLSYHSTPDLYIEVSDQLVNQVIIKTESSSSSSVIMVGDGDKYTNTAAVYKSLPQKVKTLFKTIWSWFINKF